MNRKRGARNPRSSLSMGKARRKHRCAKNPSKKNKERKIRGGKE
jgi:hypothetical protein